MQFNKQLELALEMEVGRFLKFHTVGVIFYVFMHHCCMTKLAGEAKLGNPWCRHHQSPTWWTREFYWSTLQELYHQNPLKHAWPLTKLRTWRTLHSLQAAQQIVECPSPMPRLWTSSRHLGWSQSAAQLHLVWGGFDLYCLLWQEEPSESDQSQGLPEAF